MDLYVNKKSIIIYAIILLVIFSVSILTFNQIKRSEVNENEVKYNIEAYFPLNSKMKYSYEGVGNEYASIEKDNMFVEDNYLQFIEDNGGTVVVKIYKISDQKITEVYKQGEFYKEKNLIPEIKDNKEENQIILKTPLEIGNSWDNNNQKREIVAINQILKVPAGVFYNVIKVKIIYKDSENIGYDYFAPNIGLIKTEYKGDGFVIKSILESLSIE